MAVTAGNKIARADLVSLAAIANAKTSAIFKVSPFYTSGGSPYGHKRFTNISVSSAGTGYVVGDTVSLGFSSSFTVVKTGASGKVIGLRVNNSGAGQATDTKTSPAATTGGSGTGLQLAFTFSQYGPTANFSFDEFILNYGSVTGYFIVNGGTGYVNGETLTFDELPGLSLSITTSSGVITGFSVVTPTAVTAIPDSIDEMPAIGGSGTGATFGGYFTLGKNPAWLTELNRLRSNISALGLDTESDISGPWPASGYQNSYSVNGTDVEFYYLDNGSSQSVSITDENRQFLPDEYLADMMNGITSATYTTLTWQLVVGGNANCTLSGQLSFGVDPVGGTPSISVTSSFPASFSLLTSAGGIYNYQATLSGSIAPGTYQIVVTLTNGKFHDNILGYNTVPAKISVTVSAHTSVPGISNTSNVFKIVCPVKPSPSGFPFGFWGKRIDTSIYTSGQKKLISFNASYYQIWYSPFPQLTATVSGLFTAKLPMVSDLVCATPSLMPWNFQRTKYGSTASVTVNPMLLGDLAPDSPANTARVSNSYAQTTPIESQPELPLWVASRYFTVGFTIQDSNGNIQVVSVAGTSGASAPAWATTTSATTVDGGVTWTCLKVIESADSMAPAVHRPACVPRYPFYWYSETITRLKPPTSTSGLTVWGAHNQWQRNNYSGLSYNEGWQQDNKARGWWIYSVSLNRMQFPIYSPSIIGAGTGGVGAGTGGIGAGGTPYEVDVEIGCIRGGVFSSFGFFKTGHTYKVLWPVFTSDALVYKCSERIDFQAVAISCGGVGVTKGISAAGYPISAAFYNDPLALLSKIP